MKQSEGHQSPPKQPLHYITEIVGNELKMLDRPANSGNGQQQNQAHANGNDGNTGNARSNDTHGHSNGKAGPANGSTNKSSTANRAATARSAPEDWGDGFDQELDVPF
jgi:single-stranded DNA-binding protein